MAKHRHIEPMGLWGLLFPGAHLCDRINQLERLMGQTEDRLNEAISQLGVDLGEAITRIEAKLADSNINVDDEIAQLRGFSDQLDGIAADPVEPPDEPPVEEPPVEP